MRPTTLCLFAHQDDEFGVFQQIVVARQRGDRVLCVYFTGLPFAGSPLSRRDRESLRVLAKLGVPDEDVIFVGTQLSIPDGHLLDHLETAANWITHCLGQLQTVSAIYVPAWEGGHPDHDALHGITVTTAHKAGLIDAVRQFPLYNRFKCTGPFFRVFHPLPLNGPIESHLIPWGRRFRFLRACLSYPSQATTWLGLFPFVLKHYLVSGQQLLQRVSVKRILERPHPGTLYYEQRKFCTWEKLSNQLTRFIDSKKEQPA